MPCLSEMGAQQKVYICLSVRGMPSKRTARNLKLLRSVMKYLLLSIVQSFMNMSLFLGQFITKKNITESFQFNVLIKAKILIK